MDNSLKKACIQNTQRIAKKQKKPLGKLEEEIGVSAGYLSRLNKDDNTTKISVDLIADIARVLNVSIDDLVYGVAALPTEQKRVDFVRELKKVTQDGKLKWDKFSQSTITAIRDFRYYESGSTSCPIFDHEGHKIFYRSRFTEDAGTEQVDNFYRAALVDDTYAYLVKVRYPKEKQEDYELYFITPVDDYECSIAPVCRSFPITEARFDKLLKSLYEMISETIDNIYFNPHVNDIIDKFMSGKKDDKE